MTESAAELAEMVVHVEVAPAHPFGLSHRAKDRMGWPWSGQACKLVQSGEQLDAVGLEVRGRGASDALVDLRRRLDPCRPFHGELQGDPLEQEDGNWQGS